MRLQLVLSFALVAFWQPGFAEGGDRERGAELTAAQQNILQNEVIPAYHAGNAAAILQALQPLVRKVTPAQLSAADEFLNNNDLPTVAQLLSSSRMSLVELNQLGKLPPPRGDELILTLRGLKERIQTILEMRESHVAFDHKAALPDSFLRFERRFWEMHVLEKLLSSSRRLAHYGNEWQRGSQRMIKKQLTPEDEEILTTDFAWLNTELTSMLRELSERTLELRLRRLEFAVERLKTSKDLKERFQAAYAVRLDGELLSEFYFEPSDPDAIATREQIVFCTALADSALPSRIQELISQGGEAAGEDLIHKSHLLFTGLHWWYRGRYGLGPDGNGLLKSEAALRSPEAQFALYMPRQIPQPVNQNNPLANQQGQGQGQQYPQIPRRHFQLWQFETRHVLAIDLTEAFH